MQGTVLLGTVSQAPPGVRWRLFRVISRLSTIEIKEAVCHVARTEIQKRNRDGSIFKHGYGYGRLLKNLLALFGLIPITVSVHSLHVA